MNYARALNSLSSAPLRFPEALLWGESILWGVFSTQPLVLTSHHTDVFKGCNILPICINLSQEENWIGRKTGDINKGM